MEYNLLIHLMFGPTLLLIGFLYKTFPPKKINQLYGYRTARSMRSQGAWDFSNKLSAQLLMGAGALTCLAQVVFYFISMVAENYMLWSAGALVLFLLLSIPPVEMRLKRDFDDKGAPKH